MNEDRLEYIKGYFAQQSSVTVEIPPQVTFLYNGSKAIHRFSGYRMGYKFVNGIATVSRDHIADLKIMYPNLIIHEAGER